MVGRAMMPRMIETFRALVPLLIVTEFSMADSASSPRIRISGQRGGQDQAGRPGHVLADRARGHVADHENDQQPQGQDDEPGGQRQQRAAAVLQQRREDHQGEEAVGHRGHGGQDLDDRLDHCRTR